METPTLVGITIRLWWMEDPCSNDVHTWLEDERKKKRREQINRGVNGVYCVSGILLGMMVILGAILLTPQGQQLFYEVVSELAELGVI